MLHFKVTVASANNLFPLGDKESNIFVKWKADRKVSGKTTIVPVRHNCAEFNLSNSFELTAALKMKRRAEEFKEIPCSMSLMSVVGKKSKEVAVFDFDLTSFKARADPYVVKAKVHWTMKVAKQFEPMLQKQPADLLLRVEVSDAAQEGEQKKDGGLSLKIKAQETENEKDSEGEEEQQPSTDRTERTADKEEQSKEEVSNTNNNNNNNSSGSNNPFASNSSIPKLKEEPSQANNPFAILSRKVGSEQHVSTSTSPSPSPAPSPHIGHMEDREKEEKKRVDQTSDIKKMQMENKRLREQLERSENQKMEMNKKMQSLSAKGKTRKGSERED